MSNRSERFRLRLLRPAIALVLPALLSVACGRSSEAPQASAPPTALPAAGAPEPSAAAEEPLAPPANEFALTPELRELFPKTFTGDLDEMARRRVVRVGVAVNRTFYFIDKGVQRGASYEMGVAFEEFLNKRYATRPDTKIHVVFVPLPRDLMASALTQGRVDLVVAQVVVRPEFEKVVDFSHPSRTGVSEVVVTGPGAPPIATLDDLSGKEVFARKESSVWLDLVALNEKFAARGLAPVEIHEVPGNLEDDDLLEMANAGILPIMVAQDFLAEFWKKVFTNLTVHETVALRTGASIAVPIRKESPQLAAALNDFLAKNGLGTAFGNIIHKRYLVSTSFAKSATSEAERKRLLDLIDLFRKYSDQYEMDFLLMAAQGYQESGLNQDAKSAVGAIGVMQVMPATGKELAVGDIQLTENNIHAGVKYMRFMIDRYYKDEPMDRLNKGLFAFASYNAGPARVRKLRQEAAQRGLDPNIWFGNVEQIASERIGRETVTYVSNIYKYYVAYSLIAAERKSREESREELRSRQK